mgnify:CR=1 FL=1
MVSACLIRDSRTLSCWRTLSLGVPFVREHGEVVLAPCFPGRVVAGGFGRLQQVAYAPAYGSGLTALAAADPTLAFLIGAGEGGGYCSAEAGFFGDVQEHGLGTVLSGVEWEGNVAVWSLGVKGAWGCLPWQHTVLERPAPHPLRAPRYRHCI